MQWLVTPPESPQASPRPKELDFASVGLRLIERAVAATSDGIVITDPSRPDHPIVFVNEGFLRLTGYTEGEILGRNCRFLQGPDTDPDAVREVRSAVREERSCRVVLKNYRKDGGIFWNELVVDPIRDSLGKVTHFVGVQTDITAYKQLEDTAQTEILKRLAQAAEFRDDDTGQHTQRVGELSALVAAQMGLPEGLVSILRVAAPLHDVGKIGISDLLLLKPGAFTDDEREKMKSHTRIGGQILAGKGFQLLRIAEEIALTHHERWDGCGYPHGLRGEAIPVTGRIVAVVDVYDALTHKRPYKEAWSNEAAVEEIRRMSGSAFDPQVVDAFLQVLEERASLLGG